MQILGDGDVPLAARSYGSGPSIVFVHGTIGSSGDWAQVMPLLADRFRVISYDRRGRGRSGDGEDHRFDQEVNDLLAVVEAAAEPVHIVAHSFGAIIAMGAAGNCRARSLLLYEPPLGLDGTQPEFPRIRAATAEGDREGIARAFFALASATPDEVAALEASPPAWRAVLDAAPTVERELRAIVAHRHAPEQIDAPVCVLTGALTTERIFLEGLDQMVGRLGAERLELPRQRHLALVFEPHVTAEAIRAWIESRPHR